jgi:hypothetical protein
MDTKLHTLCIKTVAIACFIFGFVTNIFGATTWICGSYTGNGGTQTITGLGFQPDAVIVKSSGGSTAFIKTSTMASTASRAFTTTGGVSTNAITGFTANGFTVDINAAVNTNGTTYYFYAFKASNVVAVGTYTGNGSANRNIVSTGGVNTKFVIIIPESTYGGSVWYSHNNNAAGYSYDDGSPTSNWASPGAVTPPTNGFSTVSGADPRTNVNLIVYHYIGFVEAAANCEVNAYTGDGNDGRAITGLGLKPYFIISTGGNTAILIRSRALTGDATQYFSATSNASNLVESFTNTGFTVGNNASVNSNIFNQTYVVLGGSTGGILPIELLHFSAERTADKKVVINWATASEQNNNYFTIEESVDGSTFDSVARITGAGNSSNRINYQFIRENPPGAPVLYYRLKQADKDGTSKTFQITAVPYDETETPFDLSIIQNPVTSDELIYDLNLPTDATMNIQIVDQFGNILSTENYYYSHGTNRYAIHINDLKAGIYILNATDLNGSARKTVRFVVNN